MRRSWSKRQFWDAEFMTTMSDCPRIQIVYGLSESNFKPTYIQLGSHFTNQIYRFLNADSMTTVSCLSEFELETYIQFPGPLNYQQRPWSFQFRTSGRFKNLKGPGVECSNN